MTTFSAMAGVGLICPNPSGLDGLNVEVLNTGWTETDWNRVDPKEPQGPLLLPFLVGKIDHPNGLALVDSGLGVETREGRYPKFILKADKHDVPPGKTAVEQLGGLPDIVLMTHLHYDHVSGLLDMTPEVEVWTTLEEWRTARTSNMLFPSRKMEAAVTWRPIDLVDGKANRRLGVPAVDVFGDETVWYLGTPGHTPGAASVLVRAEDEVWLFVGDIGWIDRHLVDRRRPSWVSVVVDGRPRRLQKSLKWARAIKEKCPTMRVVTGHEPRWATEQR